MVENKRTIVSSLIYKFIERVGYQGISFVISMILARILGPAAYGTLSILLVFTSIAQIFVQSGLNYALVQSKEVDEIVCSSVFYINLMISIFIYLVLFVSAPIVSNFYSDCNLTIYLRVLSLILFPSAYNSIQVAIAARQMDFRSQMMANTMAIIIAGTIAILMSLKGFGVWALICLQLMIQFFSCVLLSFFISWHPKMILRYSDTKKYFVFGWKLLSAQLLATIYDECITLIMGKNYNKEVIGYYNRGMQFPRLITININSAMQSVLFPVLAKRQEDNFMQNSIVEKSISYSTYLIYPLLGGLAAIAPSLIFVLLGDAWMPTVPFIQVMCIYFALQPIGTIYIQAIMSVGRSDIALKMSMIRTILGLAGLIFLSIRKVKLFTIIIYYIMVHLIYIILIMRYYCIRFHVQAWKHIKIIIVHFLLSMMTYALVYVLNIFFSNGVKLLLFQIIIGILFYVGASYFFKVRSFFDYIRLLHNIIKNK